MSEVSITKRMGTTPAQRGSTNDLNCPAVLSLPDGRIGVIGTDITDTYKGPLPEGASIGAHERLVAVPMTVVLDAIPDILRQSLSRYVPQDPQGCSPIADPAQEQ